MSATGYLELVYRILPGAFLADLLTFTFGVWFVRRWRKARRRG